MPNIFCAPTRDNFLVGKTALTHVLLNPQQVWLSCGVKPTANNYSKDDEGTESLAGISKLVTGVACCVWSVLRCFLVCLEEFSPWSMLET